jgi:hypothetical protein
VANEGTSRNTPHTSSSEHGSRMAAALLLLSLVRSSTRFRVIVSLVALGVSKQAALIVALLGHVRSTSRRRSIRAWR